MLFPKVTDHVCLTGKAGGHSGEGRRPGKQVSRWLVPSVPSRDLVAPSPWHGALVNSTQQPSQCSPIPLQGSVTPSPPSPPKLLESQDPPDRVQRWLILRPSQLTTRLRTYPGLPRGSTGAQALLLWAPSPQQAFPDPASIWPRETTVAPG